MLLVVSVYMLVLFLCIEPVLIELQFRIRVVCRRVQCEGPVHAARHKTSKDASVGVSTAFVL